MGVLVWLLIIMIEMIFLSNESMITVAILSFTFSGMFLWCLLKGFAANKRGVIGCILFTFIWGILLVLDPLVEKYTDFEAKYRVIVFAGGVTSIFLILGLYTALNELFLCKLKIEGTYVDCHKYGQGMKASYSPEFCYKVGSKTYNVTSNVSYSKRKICKYEVGQNYPIWVNENRPMTFVLERKLSKGTLSILIMGILFLLTTIYIYNKV